MKLRNDVLREAVKKKKNTAPSWFFRANSDSQLLCFFEIFIEKNQGLSNSWFYNNVRERFLHHDQHMTFNFHRKKKMELYISFSMSYVRLKIV